MATTAEIYAQAKRDEAAKQLGDLYSSTDAAYNQQVEAAKASTQNIINQLTQRANDYQVDYGKNARSAYITEQQGIQTVDKELARLGLTNTGYGVTQKLKPAEQYGQTMTDLQTALSRNLVGIDQSKATAQSDLAQTLAGLASDYASNKTRLQQWQNEYLQDIYNTAYSTKYREEQDALQLALARRSSGGSGGSGGSRRSRGSRGYGRSTAKVFQWTRGTLFKTNKDGTMTYTNPNGKSVTVDKGINPYTGKKNKDIKHGTFSNGYQPNNVGGKKLKAVTGESLNINGNQQNVWSTGKKNYVWSGAENTYYEVYKKNGEWIVK